MEYKYSTEGDPNGSSLQGYVYDGVTYHDLVKIFGMPGEGDEYKVDAEWEGSINDETFMIYNYKNGFNYNGDYGTPVENMSGDDWHIGGFNGATVSLVNGYIQQQLENSGTGTLTENRGLMPIMIKLTEEQINQIPVYNIFWFSFDLGGPALKPLHTYFQCPTFDNEEDAWEWIENNKNKIKEEFGEVTPQLTVLKTIFI